MPSSTIAASPNPDGRSQDGLIHAALRSKIDIPSATKRDEVPFYSSSQSRRYYSDVLTDFQREALQLRRCPSPRGRHRVARRNRGYRGFLQAWPRLDGVPRRSLNRLRAPESVGDKSKKDVPQLLFARGMAPQELPPRTSSICVPDADAAPDSRGKLHIAYKIQIKCGSYHQTIAKNFSEFRLFDKIRLMYCPDARSEIKLPPKIWIGNKTDRTVADRKLGLTKYLNDLVVIDVLAASLSKFLGVPEKVLRQVRKEIQALGPCCDKYGAGCYCLELAESSSRFSRRGVSFSYGREMRRGTAPAPLLSSSGPLPRLNTSGGGRLKCVHAFDARSAGQLSLALGEVVRELKTANGWHYGRNMHGQEGYFPSDRVQKVSL